MVSAGNGVRRKIAQPQLQPYPGARRLNYFRYNDVVHVYIYPCQDPALQIVTYSQLDGRIAVH